MNSLADYGSSSGDDSGDEGGKVQASEAASASASSDSLLHLKPSGSGLVSSKVLALVPSAPDVAPNSELDSRRHIKPDTKEVKYNPK